MFVHKQDLARLGFSLWFSFRAGVFLFGLVLTRRRRFQSLILANITPCLRSISRPPAATGWQAPPTRATPSWAVPKATGRAAANPARQPSGLACARLSAQATREKREKPAFSTSSPPATSPTCSALTLATYRLAWTRGKPSSGALPRASSQVHRCRSYSPCSREWDALKQTGGSTLAASRSPSARCTISPSA